MTNIKILIFAFLFLLINFATTKAQQQFATTWTSNNPFKTDVFVANHGQFNTWVNSDEPIKYAVNSSDRIFFSNHSVIYKLQKFEVLTEEEKEKQEEQEEIPLKKENKIFYVCMNWEGCNPNAELIAEEQTEGYYTFGEKGYKDIKAKGFKKLIYKNLYPNIDVEYIIPEKGGIKYSLILHPNADITQVKMKYSGNVKKIKLDKNGYIIILTPVGDITDHAPESFIKDNNQILISSFNVDKNTVGFKINAETPNTQTIVIDPWTTTPTYLTSNNVALDLDHDINGNVYVSGGSVPYKLSKYSNTGVYLWTFTNPTTWSGSNNYYSKFCVLPMTGTAYIGEGFAQTSFGAKIMKINTNGTLNYTSAIFGNNNEIYIMFYNNCSKQLIAFGGGTLNNNHNMKIIADTNLSSSISSNYNGYCTKKNDVASVRMDNNGDFYAIATSNTCSSVEGKLQKSLYSLNYAPPCVFDLQSNCLFNEINYLGFINFTTVRANAMALNSSYLYTYDGKTLKAWNKTNGNILSSIIVDNSYTSSALRVHEGIDVDYCNNVYVGGTNKVHVYQFNGTSFTQLTPITNSVPNKVFDIKINRANGKIYVCGIGFLTELNAPYPCSLTSTISTNITYSIDSCFGKACITPSGGMPPYSYYWSNGSTDSCIFGVPSGTYTVSVTDNSCSMNNIHVDTIIFNSSLQLSVTPLNPFICYGDSVTLTATSLSSATTYHWSNGVNGDINIVHPLVTTVYSVIATNNSCIDTIPVTVKVNNSFTLINKTICYGENFSVGSHTYTATGIYNDTLASYIGCDSIIKTILTALTQNLSNTYPVICNGNYIIVGSNFYSIPGTYYDTLISSTGCDSIIITHLTIGQVRDTINPIICEGESFFSGIKYYSKAGTYNDTLWTLSGCDSIVTINLTIKPNPEFSIGNDTTICNGKEVILNATYPAASYLWQDSSVAPIYIVNKAGQYWVQVSIGGCKSSKTVTIELIDCEPILEIPNFISPNSDNVNDLFVPIKTKNIIKMHTIIYNRWGSKVFETDHLKIEWDGKSNGRNLADGVYYWVIDYTDIQNKTHDMNGSLTIMR